MDPSEVRDIVLKELPRLVEEDPEVRRAIVALSTRYFPPKEETESRFDRILEELRRDREAQRLKWDEEERRWAEQERLWAEQERRWEGLERRWEGQERRWEGQERRWDEQNLKWEEQNLKWEEQNRKWDEQNRKWDENQKTINEMLASIRDLARRHESTIGALGARWGLNAEESFRNALKGILGESFGVEVVTVTERDDEGEVFGRPDQVELDLIIKDGTLLLCEIKSSMSKADMYVFERKVRFYERRHNRKAARMIVISPMVDKRGRAVAEKLGIEVYSYADAVPEEV